MTYEEFIAIAKPRFPGADKELGLVADCKECLDQYVNDMRKVINAVEKQTPKKPKAEYSNDPFELGLPMFFCPCGTELRLDQPFCEECGQAIDWSE